MTFKPFNSIDIANYIIWRYKAMGKSVTHLKLQKLLYYITAKYLRDNNELLIDAPVCKWQYGPVVKPVYHQFKIYGNSGISEPVTYLSSDSNYSGVGNFIIKFVDVEEVSRKLHQDVKIKDTVSFVLDTLGAFPAFTLVDRTHKESAWKDFEREILLGKDLTYSDNELRAANI